MVKLHVIYCYIISVMWYWTYMNLLDLSRVSWNWSILDPWRPPGITAVSAARSSRDSARRPLWIVVIHLWSRCWTMVDSFILNGEKRKKPWWFMVIHGDSSDFSWEKHGKTLKIPIDPRWLLVIPICVSGASFSARSWGSNPRTKTPRFFGPF